MNGRLIGVTTAILSETGSFAGVGFAVPVDVVNRIVPDGELDAYVDNYCKLIGENAPLTMHTAKRTVEELTRLDGKPDFARLTGLVKECFD